MKDLVDALERRLLRERAARLAAEQRLEDARRTIARLEAGQQDCVRERDAALASGSAKSAFVASVSHEIRTPLTSIIGFAELLLDASGKGVDRQEAVHTIIRNGRHLLGVVNDLLDLSKVEAGLMVAERVDMALPALLRELGELMAGRVQARGLEFRVEPALPLPAVVRGDPVRLRQILLNLVGNAVKFTRAGSVTLHLAWDGTRRVLRLSIEDTGIGMTPAQVDQLFQPFVQAEASTTRKFGGTGLGLHLSRKLAEVVGATIHVESEPGRGSVFHVDLAQPDFDDGAALLTMEGDLVEIDRPAFAITQVTAPELEGRVLVADDTPDIRRLLLAYLAEAGLAAEVAEDGRAAVEQAASRSFDLVLMDVNMPRLDGVAATRELRALGVTTPVVALTANVMASDRRRYRDAGCVDVLAKPIDRLAFFQMLERLLPGVDPAAGGEMSPELQSAIAGLRAEFLAGLPGQLTLLDLASRAADWPAAREVAHVLKGTAGSFGFPELSSAASLAELAILAQEHERAHALCLRVGDQGRRALQAA